MSEQQTIPIDPSSLTTQMVWREVGHQDKYFTAEIARLDKAIKLAHDDFVRSPTDTEKQVMALEKYLISRIENEHALKEEKFSKVYQKFESIEKQRLEQKEDTAANVDKAFNSAKELVKEQTVSSATAITKSENSVNNQLKGLDDKIADLKEKIIRLESIAVGALSQKTEQKASTGLIAAIIFGILATVTSIIGIMITLNK